jgi:hypothetical protein
MNATQRDEMNELDNEYGSVIIDNEEYVYTDYMYSFDDEGGVEHYGVKAIKVSDQKLYCIQWDLLPINAGCHDDFDRFNWDEPYLVNNIPQRCS